MRGAVMPAEATLDRVEPPDERRVNVRHCLGLLRRELASPARPRAWEHRTPMDAGFPTREVLADEVRVLRAEVARLEAVIESQWKVIEDLREALGVDLIDVGAGTVSARAARRGDEDSPTEAPRT